MNCGDELNSADDALLPDGMHKASARRQFRVPEVVRNNHVHYIKFAGMRDDNDPREVGRK